MDELVGQVGEWVDEWEGWRKGGLVAWGGALPLLCRTRQHPGLDRQHPKLETTPWTRDNMLA